MVSRGAKHLILLSRSGAENTAAKNAVASLRGEGCDVQAFACDISKKDRLQQILEECSASTPPIKGCIQGAMVLQVERLNIVHYGGLTPPTGFNVFKHVPQGVHDGNFAEGKAPETLANSFRKIWTSSSCSLLLPEL